MKQTILVTFVLLFSLFVYSHVEAAEIEDLSSSLFKEDYQRLEDGSKAYYQLDVTSKQTDEKEQGWVESSMDTVGSWMTGDAIKDKVLNQFYEGLNFFTNIMFRFNIFMTNTMLSTLAYSYEFDVVNQIIEKVEVVVQNITGIQGGSFMDFGLFGMFLTLITACVVIAVVYQFFFKKAEIETVETLLKSFFVLVFALVLFTNYGTIMKGLNQLTTEVTGNIMGASGSLLHEASNQEVRTDLSKNIWDIFVHRPYLFMQYGTDQEEQIGTNRVEELLRMKPGEERQKYVERIELIEINNEMMTYSKVPDRVVFTMLYQMVNGITSIPIFALALLIIAFQFWFLTMASVAPFVLVLAAFPHQMGMLKRYLGELMLPLLLKLVVSVIALVIFTMASVVYSLNDTDGSGYFVTALVQFIILILLFILRKRFYHILFAGGTTMRMISQEMMQLDRHMLNLGKTAMAHAMGANYGGYGGLAETAVAKEAYGEKEDVPDHYGAKEGRYDIPLENVRIRDAFRHQEEKPNTDASGRVDTDTPMVTLNSSSRPDFKVIPGKRNRSPVSGSSDMQQEPTVSMYSLKDSMNYENDEFPATTSTSTSSTTENVPLPPINEITNEKIVTSPLQDQAMYTESAGFQLVSIHDNEPSSFYPIPSSNPTTMEDDPSTMSGDQLSFREMASTVEVDRKEAEEEEEEEEERRSSPGGRSYE